MSEKNTLRIERGNKILQKKALLKFKLVEKELISAHRKLKRKYSLWPEKID